MVGNGAAELIKSLMEHQEGTVGVIRPTFEEYPNRYSKEQQVIFVPDNEDLAYTADDLMAFFGANPVGNLLLINPDNPTGNYVPKRDVLRLVAWCKERRMQLVVDESFVDFADEENSSLISEDILSSNPHLVVVKSISKSYGVPGIRLGVLASGDEGRIAQMKKDVAIWNINSFGEFYMQIAEKYSKHYTQALMQLRKTRKEFFEQLNEIPGLHLIPSQANYITAEITNGVSAKDLTKKLLINHSILIKDLSGKIQKDSRQFVRLAIRNEGDNRKLIDALKRYL